MVDGTDADEDASSTSPAITYGDPLLTARITADRVTELRHKVAAVAAAVGLTGTKLEDFVLAVHELVANVVRHGGGFGELLLHRYQDRVTCRVSDHGRGMNTAVPELPRPDRPGNRGLWLAQHLLASDLVLHSTPHGLTATVSITITPSEAAK
ncbi:ATP-binding protein [Micromonospora sp. NPDC004540]|uniref:ATP-binding protein n=1 Tax=Micromonospora sp. NPDC004540 TaxID=3154457 RepID=UPI0033B3599D